MGEPQKDAGCQTLWRHKPEKARLRWFGKEDVKLVGLREEGEGMNEAGRNWGWGASTQRFTLCAIRSGSASPARLSCQLTSTKHIDEAASTPLTASGCRR